MDIDKIVEEAEYIGQDVMTIDENAEVQGYGPKFLLWELSGQTNALKAKIYNLIDSVVLEEKQNKAVKGLLKDFTSKFYWDMHESIVEYLNYKKILDPEESGSYVDLEEEGA